MRFTNYDCEFTSYPESYTSITNWVDINYTEMIY